jgi:hypothetical protein
VTISKGSKGSNQGTNRSLAYLRHSVALITCENRGSDCLTCQLPCLRASLSLPALSGRAGLATQCERFPDAYLKPSEQPNHPERWRARTPHEQEENGFGPTSMQETRLSIPKHQSVPVQIMLTSSEVRFEPFKKTTPSNRNGPFQMFSMLTCSLSMGSWTISPQVM